MPDLVLFSRQFPFGKGESFLGDELPHLSHSFGHVLLVPLLPAVGMRSVPRGVAVDSSLALGQLGGISFRATLQVLREAAADLAARPRPVLSIAGGSRLLRFTRGAFRVVRWMSMHGDERTANQTVYYSYWLDQAAVGLAIWKALGHRFFFVSRAHGWDVFEDRHAPPYLPLRRVLFRHVDQIHSVSGAGRESLISRYPTVRDRIRVSRLGSRPTEPCRVSPPGEFKLVSCSWLTAVKRVDRIVDGLALAAALLPEVRFDWTHLGGGPLRATLEARAATKLNGRANWRITGELPHDAVVAYYRDHAVDAFLSTSASEGIPVAVLEAMAAGVAVVATDVGGVNEAVGGGNGVLLSPTASPSDVATVLVDLATRPALLSQLGSASRTVWQRDFRADANYSRFARTLAVSLAERRWS